MTIDPRSGRTSEDAGVSADTAASTSSRPRPAQLINFRDGFERAGSAAQFQESIRAAERTAHTISQYQPHIIPGLLQTADYARQMLNQPGGPVDLGLSQDEIEQLVEVRMHRQEILREPGRDIVIIIGEAALRSAVAERDTMDAVREHIAQLATAAHGVIGIMPFDRPMPVTILNGWSQLHDVVTVETSAGDLVVTDPAETSKYEHYRSLLLRRAITGRDAAQLCHSISSA